MEKIKKMQKGSFWLITLGCVCIAIGALAAIYHHNSAKNWSIDDPDTVVSYYDPIYTEVGSGQEPQQLCTELAAEGECSFASDTSYEISFELPDEMLAEIAEKRGSYAIDITYDYSVAAGKLGYIWFTISNPQTKRVYIAQSAFGAETDIHLQHEMTGTGLSEDGKSIKLVLKTTSSPSNGPFQTTFPSELGDWSIAKIERD